MFILPLVAIAVADVPLVDSPYLNIEEKSRIVYRYLLETDRPTGITLRLKDPIFHGMRWSKWGDLSPFWELCTPLATGGAQASWGLVTAMARRNDAPLPAALSVRRTNCPTGPNSCTADIHRPAYTEIELLSDLQSGDEVVVVLGDTEACLIQCQLTNSSCDVCNDCGFETPDRAFENVPIEAEWCLNEDCTEAPTTEINISAQPQLKSIWLSAPSTVQPSSPFALKVALLDYRGNPVPQLNAQINLVDASLAIGDANHSFLPSDGGWHDFEVQLEDEGVHRIEIQDGQGNRYTSPPIWVSATHESQLFWGDIHVHHGWTTWTDDGERIDHNHRYGRDVMGLDIVSESMKARGIEIEPDLLWSELQDNCRQYSEDGEYLALLGFEWIGDPAAAANCGDNSCSQGHHNIYYKNCDGALGDLDPDIIDGLEGEKGLWTWLRQQALPYTSIPHAMQYTRFDYDARDPSHQSIAEIYSEWGDNSVNLSTAGSTAQMLSAGLRLGWIGGSDNHDGWMGNPESVKNTPSGLAAFWSTALNHDRIFESIQNRQSFATTGHRPILDFHLMDLEQKIPMGSAYLPAQPRIHIRYHGTAPLESLRLYALDESPNAAREVLWEAQAADLDIVEQLYFDELRDLPTQQGLALWFEAIQSDGEKAWSSPIWLSHSCEDPEMTDILDVCSTQEPSTQDSSEPLPPAAQSPKTESRCQALKGVPSYWLCLSALALVLRRRS